MVQQAFAKEVDEATEGEKGAVEFFYKNIVATLDGTVTSDAMYGRTVMEALDEKTKSAIQEGDERDTKLKLDKDAKWRLNTHLWVATMATAALLMDPKTGASDTASIVHNMRKEKGAARK